MATPREFETKLAEVLSLYDDLCDDAGAPTDEMLADARVETFSEAGVMTRDAGLVVTLEDGSEFQVTIIRSR